MRTYMSLFVLVLSWPAAEKTTYALSCAPSNVHTLLLCRHGDSIWNGGQEGQTETFTGWTDVPLSDKGQEEAKEAARELATYYNDVDLLFTSTLHRAQATAQECLRMLSSEGKHPIVHQDYRLNERHYGDLQGLVKADVEDGKYGHDAEHVRLWRRSWHVRPPPMKDHDPRRLTEFFVHGRRCGGRVPNGESLEMVAKNRVRPFLDNTLTPCLDKAGKHQGRKRATAVVVAHANSLRALIGVLCEVEDDPVALDVLESLGIPTGVPLVMHFQRLANGKYRACDLPATTECLVRDTNGWISHPRAAPSNLGHPSLPVWPLNTCIPMELPYEEKEIAFV